MIIILSVMTLLISLIAAALYGSSIKASNKIQELRTANNELNEVLASNVKQHTKSIADAIEVWRAENEPIIRADAIKRSVAVKNGFNAEHLAPLLSQWKSREMRHIANPIDYVIFEGAENNECTRITFLDIKTGKAQLSKVERAIRNAVVAKHVVFATFNPETMEIRFWPNESTTTTSTTPEARCTESTDGTLTSESDI